MAFGVFKKLFQGLSRTREGIASTIQSVLGGAPVDEAVLDDLESSLLVADLGPQVVSEVIRTIRDRARREVLDGRALRAAVRDALRAALPERPSRPGAESATPKVVFVVGVNGGGKTTTIGKLASREKGLGRRVMVVAADTFRAAAIDQLERWVERAGAELVKQKEGADPSAVVFDALRSAKSHRFDTVFVDTAGRLHTKSNLMAELGKMARVASREVEGAPHEVLLVIDATTGQNGLTQAREFTRAATVTGVVLTKLDGTAKGGVALSIQRELGVPIRFVGVGEAVDDLLEFDPDAFVEGLLGEGEGA
jgi:fused signal recognition particle receptor